MRLLSCWLVNTRFARSAHNVRHGSDMLVRLLSFDGQFVLRCARCFDVAFRLAGTMRSLEMICAKCTQRFDVAFRLLSSMAVLVQGPQSPLTLTVSCSVWLQNWIDNLCKMHTMFQRGPDMLSMSPGWVKTDMGGEFAPLTPSESVKGILQTIAQTSLVDTGRFLNYLNTKLPYWMIRPDTLNTFVLQAKDQEPTRSPALENQGNWWT